MVRSAFIILLALGLTGIADVAGAQSDQVLHVQKRLEELGFDPGPIDGLMGSRTRRAIRNFQKQAVLPVTGELDPRTLDALAPPYIEEAVSQQESPSRPDTRVPTGDAERIDRVHEEAETQQEPPSRPSPRAPISDAKRVDQPQDSTNPDSRNETRATAVATKEASQRPIPSSDGGTKGAPRKGNPEFEDDVSSAGARSETELAASGSFRNSGLVMYLQRAPDWLWWTMCIGGLFLLWKVSRRRTKAPIARWQRETASFRENKSAMDRDRAHPETSSAHGSPPGVRSAPPRRTATVPPPPAQERTVVSRASTSVWPAKAVRPRPSGTSRKLRWVPAGESVTIAGRNIGGMVYVGPETAAGHMDNGFIDPSKPVAGKADDLQATGMPYWPNYSTIHPRSRATYLAWLASGRSDTDYSVGYVFLYFYGLEWRFFIDSPDRDERKAIIAEVGRLLDVYGSNGSVRNYMGSFLQAARLVTSDDGEPVPEFEKSGYEIPISVRLAIGRMLQDGKPVPAEWMLSWLVTHPESRLRTPAKRSFPEFKALFGIRCNDRFPNGVKVTRPRRTLSFSYRASSGNFEIDLTERIGGAPDIARLSRPLDRISPIVEEVTTELDKFSRYLGRNPDGRGSIEAHALLPDPLRALFPCPEMDELKAWAQDRIAQGGLVPVAALIERLEGVRPDRIGRRQLTGAADALARLAIGMAPDPRFALRSPRLGEPVVLFPLPGGVTRLEDVSEAYPSALLSLVLGTFIAHADGTVSESERRHLTAQFETSGILDASEKARLHANLEWMMAVPPDLGPIRKRLKDVGEEIRHELGRLTLAIVGADGVIDPAEIEAIRKLYRILGLEAKDVYSELHELAAAPGPVTVFRPRGSGIEYVIPPQPEEAVAQDPLAPIILDRERVSAIMADTARVSNVLHGIFSGDEDDTEDVRSEDMESTAPDRDERFAGLDARHRSLAGELIRQPAWTPETFEKLARQFGLMPSGALETINEWAFDRFDEALIEEDGIFEVNPEILDASVA